MLLLLPIIKDYFYSRLSKTTIHFCVIFKTENATSLLRNTLTMPCPENNQTILVFMDLSSENIWSYSNVCYPINVGLLIFSMAPLRALSFGCLKRNRFAKSSLKVQLDAAKPSLAVKSMLGFLLLFCPNNAIAADNS